MKSLCGKVFTLLFLGNSEKNTYTSWKKIFNGRTVVLLGLFMLAGQVNAYEIYSTKKGVGNGSAERIETLHSSWYYNWNIQRVSGVDPAIEYVPMKHNKWWRNESQLANIGEFGYFLGFNEPESSSQGNISVADAISQWPSITAAVEAHGNPGAQMGSPATANPKDPWIIDFMTQAEAGNLRVDFMAMHKYPTPGSTDAIMSGAQWYHDTYNRDVWITEFNAADWNAPNNYTQDQSYTWMAELLFRMESTSYIKRYAIFPWNGKSSASSASPIFKVDAQGNTTFDLTPLGTLYAEYRSIDISGPYVETWYHLHNKGSHRRLQDNSGIPSAASIFTEGASVEFELIPSGGGKYYIVNYGTGDYLGSDGTTAYWSSSETGSSVQWSLTASAYNWVNISHAASGKYLYGKSNGEVGLSGSAADDTFKWSFLRSGWPYGVTGTPTFSVDPINRPVAEVGFSYSDTIADTASDREGDSFIFSKSSGPNWLNVAAGGEISGTPLIADVGLNAFTVQVDDGSGGIDSATLNILVKTNTPPAFSVDPITMPNAAVGSGYSRAINDSASDVDDDSLVYSKVSGPLWLSVAPNGYLSGVPSSADQGLNAFIVSVDDGKGGSDTATLKITVDPQFIPIQYDNFETGLGSWVSGGSDAFLSFDNALDTQCVNLRDNSGAGSSIWSATPLNLTNYSKIRVKFSYLTVSMEGSEDFWIQFSDDGGSSWTTVKEFINGTDFVNGVRENATVDIDAAAFNFTSNVKIRFQCDASRDDDNVYIDNVLILAALGEASNSAPVFTADPINANNAAEDVVYSETIADLATDADSDPLIYSKVSGPAWLSVAGNGALSGTPGNSAVGLNVFTVQVDDDAGGSDTATLNITVDATPNNPPAFTVDPINEANATQDAAYSGSVANATDADGDSLTYSKYSGPEWLNVAASGALSGTPGNSDVGSNVFIVQVDDGNGDMDIATLNITVNNVNDAPAWSMDPVEETAATEDAAYGSTLADDAADIDAEASLTYDKVSGPSWLNIASDGALSGMPGNDDVGTNSWTVSVSDGIAAPVEAALNIVVANVNDAPQFTVNPINEVDATADVAYSGSVANATDEDGDVLVYSKVTGPVWLSVAGNGAISGVPEQSDAGSNNWTVQVVDGNGGTNSATLNVQVLALLVGYNAWTNAYNMTGYLAIATNDYDADGAQNLWEYGADGNPTNPSLKGILPIMNMGGESGSNWYEYVYVQRTNANHGLNYTVMQTANLVDQLWSNSVDAVIVGTGPAANSDFMTVTNRISVEGKNQEFLHLRIQQQ